MTDDTTPTNGDQASEEHELQPRGDSDPATHPTPPGNPPVDDEAVEKAEDQLGRVTGR